VRGLLLLAATLILQACASPSGEPARNGPALVPGYRVVRDVRLAGDTTRWDYQAYDPVAHRLYIAHLGAGEVVAFDTERQMVVATVRNVAGVRGLALAPELHRLYATATGRDELAIIDTDRFVRVAGVPAGANPDGVAYAPGTGRVFVSDQGGAGDTVVDATVGRFIGTVELGGSIGNSQYDPATDRVYVAVGGTNELAAVDPHSLLVASRYRLDGCAGAHGIQVDAAERHRVIVSCEDNARLVAVDLTTGRSAPPLVGVGDAPDVLALDPRLNRLYVAAESGVLAVFDVGGPSLRLVARGYAGPNAHSVAVDPRTHVAYLPLTDVGGHPVLRELAPLS